VIDISSNDGTDTFPQFLLHSTTPLVQKHSWLLQPLQDQERGFLPRPTFWVWHHAGPPMSLVSLISIIGGPPAGFWFSLVLLFIVTHDIHQPWLSLLLTMIG
jgi:hypothetical protein